MMAKARREDTEDYVKDFLKKHPLARELGGEYITLKRDNILDDIVQLVADICDIYLQYN